MDMSHSYIDPNQIFASIAVAKGYTWVVTLLVLYVSDSHKRTSLPTLEIITVVTCNVKLNTTIHSL
jgi:hypothetical protein